MLHLPSEGILLEQVSPKSKEGVKKLVLVSATSTPVIGIKEEAVETAEAIKTSEVDEEGKESKGKYPNLAHPVSHHLPEKVHVRVSAF